MSTAASTGGRTSRSVSAIDGAWVDAEAVPTTRSYMGAACGNVSQVCAAVEYPYDGGTMGPERANHTNRADPCRREPSRV